MDREPLERPFAMTDDVEIAHYDPQWPQRFALEASPSPARSSVSLGFVPWELEGTSRLPTER